MTFRYNTRHLSPQVQQIISKRDSSDRLLTEKPKMRATESVRSPWPISIFMKLGYDSVLAVDGSQTIKAHEETCSHCGFVWFSTNALATGMSKGRITELLGAANAGEAVEMYFAVANPDGEGYELSYVSEVVDIASDAIGILTPERSMTPDRWRDERRKIWIKLRGLAPCTYLTISDFVVASTKNTLADSIANSQFSFGYIRRK